LTAELAGIGRTWPTVQPASWDCWMDIYICPLSLLSAAPPCSPTPSTP